MKRTAIALSVALFAGCTSMPTVEQIGTPQHFAECAAADVATTAYFLGIHRQTMVAAATKTHYAVFHEAYVGEADPIVKALFIHGIGRVAGTLVPLIGLSIGAYYALKWINKPAVTATAAGLTCFGAGRNLWISR